RPVQIGAMADAPSFFSSLDLVRGPFGIATAWNDAGAERPRFAQDSALALLRRHDGEALSTAVLPQESPVVADTPAGPAVFYRENGAARAIGLDPAGRP